MQAVERLQPGVGKLVARKVSAVVDPRTGGGSRLGSQQMLAQLHRRCGDPQHLLRDLGPLLHRKHALGRAAVGSYAVGSYAVGGYAVGGYAVLGRLVGTLELGPVCEHQYPEPVGGALLGTRLREVTRLVVHEAEPTKGKDEGAVGQLLAFVNLIVGL